MVWQFFKDLSIELYNPMILLLGIYTKESRDLTIYVFSVFTAALFIIGKKWKQLKCPSVDKLINKMQCIQTVEYYPAFKN